MTELLTAAQMRAIEEAAIASGAVTGLALMERAGRGVVKAIFAEWPELAAPAGGVAAATQGALPPVFSAQDEEPHRAVVLCGPGNNGGDGFVVARLLKEEGWDVDVFLYGDPEKLPPDARVNYARWREMGAVSTFAIDAPPLVDDCLNLPNDMDIIIDAVFGTGLARPFRGVFSILELDRDMIVRAGVKMIAIDMPSGLCADSGRVLGGVLTADLTVTFHRQKPGHLLADGPCHCGAVVICDIGLDNDNEHQPSNAKKPVALKQGKHSRVDIVNAPRAENIEKKNGHKYTHGHALILSGGVGKGGAARLAARGALRVGAGVVTLGCPPAALIENAAQLNAVMLRQIRDADMLTEILEDTRINTLCLGPGMGVHDEGCRLVEAGLKSGRALVLDADAVTLIAAQKDLFAMLHKHCVLTPHAGEFARLFPDIADKLNTPATKGPAYSKVDATREAARRAGCVVLFKGPDTVIADTSGGCRINASAYERAVPWLATAGSGDVLAGFITGLLARGFNPMQAAETGAWLHTECALSFGPGLIAEDLPEELPKVLRALDL